MKEIDRGRIEKAVFEMLIALGDNPNREGLSDTPKRVAHMLEEMFWGMRYTNAEIVDMFNKCFVDVKTGELVTVSDIPIFSHCEHHLALMYNMKVHVGYIPSGKVIGLSKIARIADLVSKRLQLQERIGEDIIWILHRILQTPSIIVVVEGEHSCMTARGINKPGMITRTAALCGVFESDPALRQEFYSLIKK